MPPRSNVLRRVVRVARALRQGDAEEQEEAVEAKPSLLPKENANHRRIHTSERLDLLRDDPCVIDNSGWISWCWSWMRRFMMKNIDEVKLYPGEKKLLIDTEHLGPRAAQYVAWRAVLLITGAVFSASIVVVDALLLAQTVSYEEHRNNMMVRYAGDRYQQYFEGLIDWTLFHKVGSLMASSLAVVFAVLAGRYWSRLNVSKDAVRMSFLFSFVPAFAINMVIPFRHSVDFHGLQQQMCKDLVNGTHTASDDIQVGTLGVTLNDGFGIRLSDDFCDDDPAVWGDMIVSWLDSLGVLFSTETGSCPRADADINALDAIANSTGMTATTVWSSLPNATASTCSDECANCSTACKDHLVYLNGLVNVYGANAVSTLQLKTAARHCQHCVSPDESLQCSWACRDVRMTTARMALTGSSAQQVHLCLNTEDVSDFQVLLKVGTETLFWELAVGAYFAILSALALLPLTFTLLLGASKGATIAKTVIPYSRLPGVVSASAATFTFPFVAMFCVLFQNILGTWLTLCGITFLLLGFLGYMRPGHVKVNTYKSLKSYQKMVGKFTNGCFFISATCFCVAFVMSDSLATFTMMLEKSGWSIADIDLAAVRKQALYWVLGMTASVFGKSMISTVFFADTIISLMHTFHHGEDNDAFEIQWARMQLLKDLGTADHRGPGPLRIIFDTLRKFCCCCKRSADGAVLPRSDDAQIDDHANTLEALMGLLKVASAGASPGKVMPAVPPWGLAADPVVLNKAAASGGEPGGAGADPAAGKPVPPGQQPEEPAAGAASQLAGAAPQPARAGDPALAGADGGEPSALEMAIAAWGMRRLAWAQDHVRSAQVAVDEAASSLKPGVAGLAAAGMAPVVAAKDQLRNVQAAVEGVAGLAGASMVAAAGTDKE